MTATVEPGPSWDPAAVVGEVLARLPAIRRTAPPLVGDELAAVLDDAEHATDEEVAVLANLVALLGDDDPADLVMLHDLVEGLGLAGLVGIQRRLLGEVGDPGSATLTRVAGRRLGDARDSHEAMADVLGTAVADSVVIDCRDVAAALVVTGRSLQARSGGRSSVRSGARSRSRSR